MSLSEDKLIRREFAKLSDQDASYWEYRKSAAREGVHGLLQYPAMMVPRMQGDVLDVMLRVRPDIRAVLDPFVGSGTTMTESMIRGRSFTGLDINPLAALTCEAKSHRFDSKSLHKKSMTVLARISADNDRAIDVDFPGLSKWFTARASVSLSKIRRGIQEEASVWARKIFWIVLAETIRQTSNSRPSTFKLHVRPEREVVALRDPLDVFNQLIVDACNRFAYHEQILLNRELLAKGKYLKSANILCSDIKSNGGETLGIHDFLITSPPYGDNHSTVPYGQFSFLALNWIPGVDRPGAKALLSSTQAIDTESLGGRRRGAQRLTAELVKCSPAFKQFLAQIRPLGRKDLEAKVCSFVGDFSDAIGASLSALAPDSYLVWTLGNRTVGGISVPLVSICEQLQRAYGLKYVTTVRRRIPSKRTPIRNSISQTMSEECLLVMRT